MKRIAFGMCVAIAFFASSLRLPAISCPVASPGEGARCEMGCCANKCCCLHSKKSEPTTPRAVNDNVHGQPLLATVPVQMVSFAPASGSTESRTLGADSADGGIRRPLAVVLCTFLI